VSLVERSGRILRERNQSLERKLKELVDVARANDALADRIHRLSQRLIRVRTLPETISAVEASLREDFDAMHSVLVAVPRAGAVLGSGRGPVLAFPGTRRRDVKTFESLRESGKPRCGQVRDAQRDYLFGKDSVEIGRWPSRPSGPRGAGNSGDRRQRCGTLSSAMSTEFLSRSASS